MKLSKSRMWLSLVSAVAAMFAGDKQQWQPQYSQQQQGNPTTVQSMAGATLGVSATLPVTFDAAGFDASSMVYTLIGEIEDYGNHGVTSAVMKFTPVDTAVVTKRKGSKDYGTMTMKLGNVPADVGQVILRAASESKNPYAFEMKYPEGETHYISALVSEFMNEDGQVDNIQRISLKLELDRQPVIIASA